VEIDKKQLNLGRHPDNLPAPSKRKGEWDPPPEILREFYRLMASRNTLQVSPGSGYGPLVVAVLDAYLE
jgi:hypothetical protein